MQLWIGCIFVLLRWVLFLEKQTIVYRFYQGLSVLTPAGWNMKGLYDKLHTHRPLHVPDMWKGSYFAWQIKKEEKKLA